MQTSDFEKNVAKHIKGSKPAPVHLWNPPFCGNLAIHIDSNGRWYNEKSEIISFIHYEPTLWSLPFGLQFKFDKELRDQEYILQKRDFRIFSNPNRYGYA